MKKLAVLGILAGLLAAFPFNAKAEGIEAGQHMFTMSLGGASAVQKAGYKSSALGLPSDKETEWGKRGIAGGLSYIVFPSEYLGIGLEVSDGFFGGDEYKMSKPGHEYKIDTGMNVLNAMATFRVNLNPKSSVRIYVPAGMGYAWSTNLLVIEDKTGGETKKDKYHTTSGSLTYFAGLGFEIDLGSNWSLGGEARYHSFTNDTDKIGKKYNHNKLIGKQEYGYIAVLFKASYRF